MDRISQLPDTIHHQILLQLQKQDQTLKSLIYFSLISKSCCHAWLTYPHLAFTCIGYSKMNINDFISRVDRTLQRVRSNSLTLDSFSLIGCFNGPQDDLNRWLRCVIVYNVSLIDLDFCLSSNNNIVVSFPLFSHVGSLLELRIRGCFLETSDATSGVTLISLKKLRLECIRERGNTIEDVIRCCPLLEHLEIVSCSQIKSLFIAGVSKLQSFSLVGYMCTSSIPKPKEVIIDVPCLKEFECNWNLSHIPFLSNVDSWPCLKKLCLTGPLNEEALEELLIQLYGLEYLSLYDCNWVISKRSPKISSHSIRTLHLIHCKFKGTLFIDCPSLCLVYYEDNLVPRIDKESSFASECKFDLYLTRSGYQYHSKLWFFADLRVFLLSRKISVTCLKIELSGQPWYTDGVGFGDDKAIEMPQLVKVEYLKLKLMGCDEFTPVLLDSLLCICLPDYIVFTFSKMDYCSLKTLLQLIRDMSTMKTKTRPSSTFECCCDGKELVHECWYHTLKDVKLDWTGTTRGKDKEFDFKSMDLNIISQQIRNLGHGSTNLRVCIRLVWNNEI